MGLNSSGRRKIERDFRRRDDTVCICDECVALEPTRLRMITWNIYPANIYSVALRRNLVSKWTNTSARWKRTIPAILRCLCSFSPGQICPTAKFLVLAYVNEKCNSTFVTDPTSAEADAAAITKQQLAERLGVSVRTVEQWMHRRIIPYIKPGKAVRFFWPDVQQALRRNFGVGYPPGISRQNHEYIMVFVDSGGLCHYS